MIRRIALAAAVLVLVAVLGLPPMFGARARALIEAELATVGDSLRPDAELAASLDEWEAGWFSSTATLTVAADAERRIWRDGVTLHHGPVIIGGLSGLGWGSAEFAIDTNDVPDLADFRARTGVDEIGRIAALVGFFGGTTVAVDVYPFQTADDAPDGSVRFAGFDARIAIDRTGSRVEAAGTMHGASATAPDTPLVEIGRLDAEARLDQTPGPTDLWLGEGTFDLARLVFRDEESGNTLEMDDAQFEADVSIEGEEILWTSRHTARALRVATIAVDDVELNTSIAYPLASALRAAQSDPAELADDFMREHMTLRVDPLRFSHRDMPLVARLDVDYRGDRLPAGTTPDVANLPGIVAADLELSMHKDLLDAFGLDIGNRLMRAMVDQGIAEESDDSYALQASFRDGRLTSNGQQVDLALLIALLAAA